MKFANYKFYARGVNNLGDNMQLIAIDYIYEQMGIPKEDIIYIDKNDLSTYKGEYVILPVSMPLVDYTEGGISGRFSDHIIPVFLGLTMVLDTLMPAEVDYYHQFEPIGCRDERTLNTLRKYGINAYLHGCITAAFPTRSKSREKQDKVFIVDISSELEKYIPEDIKRNAVYLTHMHTVNDTMNYIDDPKNKMQEYYERYKNEASLIITAKLHCAVPCMAAGIPVVLAKTQISYRFGWLEKLLPIYSTKDFQNIDWNPNTVEYEDHKKRLLEITIHRLRDAYSKYNGIYDLSWFYENRTKSQYIVDAFESVKQYIDRKFDVDETFEYSIWGLTQISTLTVNYLNENYPRAKLMHVYDAYRTVEFEGKRAEAPEMIRNYPHEIIFVTTNGAKEMALRLFNEIGKDQDSFVFFEPVR